MRIWSKKRSGRVPVMPTWEEQLPGIITVAVIMVATLGALWLFGAAS